VSCMRPELQLSSPGGIPLCVAGLQIPPSAWTRDSRSAERHESVCEFIGIVIEPHRNPLFERFRTMSFWPPPPPPPPPPVLSYAEAIGLGVALGLSGLFAIGVVFLYPRCAGCPSAYTPLGTALDIGNGTGACIPGSGTSRADCTYSFPITTFPSGAPPATVPSAPDLSFQLQNSVGSPLNSTFTITLVSSGGSPLEIWNSSTASWGSSLANGTCGGFDCYSLRLATGDSLVLRAVPLGGLPYSHQGDRLEAAAHAGGFSGWVDASID
jgi:hypothetical protein